MLLLEVTAPPPPFSSSVSAHGQAVALGDAAKLSVLVDCGVDVDVVDKD